MEELVQTLLKQNASLLETFTTYTNKMKQLESDVEELKKQSYCARKVETSFSPDRTYRSSEILPLLNVTRMTLHNWIKQGKFPAPFVKSSNIGLWRGVDLIRWFEQ